MNKDSAILVIPNTKDGLSALKYLSNELVKHEIFIKLVSKKEFEGIIKNG